MSSPFFVQAACTFLYAGRALQSRRRRSTAPKREPCPRPMPCMNPAWSIMAAEALFLFILIYICAYLYA